MKILQQMMETLGDRAKILTPTKPINNDICNIVLRPALLIIIGTKNVKMPTVSIDNDPAKTFAQDDKIMLVCAQEIIYTFILKYFFRKLFRSTE